MEAIIVPTDTEVDAIIASGDKSPDNWLKLGFYIGAALEKWQLKDLAPQVRDRVAAIIAFLRD
jgi:hypothetical protein